MNMKMNTQTETTQAERELSDAIAQARGIAKKHRDLDSHLGKKSTTMTLQEIQITKERIKILRKDLNRAINKVHKKGGEWDNEAERNLLDKVA